MEKKFELTNEYINVLRFAKIRTGEQSKKENKL